MARTTFKGPVRSKNGFEGEFKGGISGDVGGDVKGDVKGNIEGDVEGLVLGGTKGAVVPDTLILPAADPADLIDEANALNTTGKVAGLAYVDLATGLIYTAAGDGVNDKWLGSDGTTDITPAV